MNSKNNLISVVIPAFNEEHYIEATLQALNEQTYPRECYEIVVVDNNSTDQTPKIAEGLGARIVQEKISGYVSAYNKGVFSAKYGIVAVTDADTKVAPTWLENINKAFNEKEDLVALTGEIRPDTSSKLLGVFLAQFFNLFVYINFLLGKPHITGSNIALRKEYFEKIGGMDTRYKMSSDVELGLRLKKLGKVGFYKNIWVLNSTRRWEKGALKAFFEYMRGYFNTVWLQKPPKEELEVYR